jgi:hypothetical protein
MSAGRYTKSVLASEVKNKSTGSMSQVVQEPCYKDEADRLRKWRWGVKKGARRGRRRFHKELIQNELDALGM